MDAVESSADHPGEGMGQESLASAGHIFEKQMPLCQHADKGQTHDFGFTQINRINSLNGLIEQKVGIG